MGSGPESTRFLLQQLQNRPHTIRWSAPRVITLRRGDNHKLGFRFKTFSCQDDLQTVTVVVLVKDDCRIDAGSLQVGDRIVGVGNVLVTSLDEVRVKQVFSQSQEPTVQLQVSASSQIKRILSINSGTSGGSVTASVDSCERPQVKKRFHCQKSSSSESSPPTPVSPSVDLTSSSSSTSFNQPSAVETSPTRRRQPCGARECVPSGRSGFPFPSPHLSQHHYYSLPDRMEGDIILPDDIVLCEADGPNSLPPVLTPLPNTPTPSLTQPPGCGAFVSTVSTGIGGALAVGGESQGGGSAPPLRSLGVEVCRAPGCGAQRACVWHKFVLTYPQHVVWDPSTKTVELEKRDCDNFGFKYKVKKYDSPPAEVFVLVTEVVSGGAAWSLLLSGDWIRSINGMPINSPKEAFRLDFRKLSSLRLVIQRPEGLSQKGVPKLKVLADSLGIHLNVPVPVPADAAPQPSFIHDNRHPPLAYHNSRYTDRHVVAGVEEMSRVVAKGQNLFDPLLERYPGQTQSPGEHIPLNTLSRPVLLRSRSLSDRCVLPQARLVVCGAHGSAVDMVRGLLGENGGVEVDPEAPVQSFQLSLQRHTHSGTSLHPQHERLSTLMKECESYACGAGECRQEGADSLRCMNIELYVIGDEQFFDHCCAWLLPSTTLIVLTFQVHKLLNQPQVETGRLAAMAHTLQACTYGDGGSTNIPTSRVLLYGVSSGSQYDVSSEEVQGMFYVTDSGSRLLEQQGLAVSVASPTCGRSMGATRQALFSACCSRLRQVPAPQCVARVVDALSAASGVKMFGGEVTNLVNRVLGDSDPVMVQSVISSLVDSGCLLPCGNCRSPKEGQPQDYLLPFRTFQALSTLLIKPLLDSHSTESRQKWFRLMTTGRVSRSELVELLALEGSSLTVDLLEQMGILFTLQPSLASGRGDSGFAEDAKSEFVIPYFVQEAREERGGEGTGFVVRFERHVSWRDFYNMLCKLSTLPATEEVVIRGQGACVVRHNGLWLSLRWNKGTAWDSMVVTIIRLQGGRESPTVPELERLFSFVIPAATPFRVQVRDTTIPSSNLPSRQLDTGPSVARPARPCRPASPHEETFVKPVVAVADSSLTLPEGGEGGAYDNLPLTELPWSVLNQAAILLTVNMPTGHDWRSVAELAGKSMAEIYAYEVISPREVPAMSFLREWMLTGTVQHFLDILQELDRPDVRDLILNYLKDRTVSERERKGS